MYYVFVSWHNLKAELRGDWISLMTYEMGVRSLF